ncbi:MAG: pyridoxal phosphate-dependent decarboxylase family protein [Bryobacteraceae bacterium]
MSPEEFRAAAHEAVDWMADYLRDIRNYPVLPQVEPGALIDRLPRQGPEQGESIEAIFEDFRELIVPGITHWNHPRFHGYFSISASGPGILGEMLTAALNVQHMLWQASPAATELEQTTLGWLRQWLRLPKEFFGMIHDTASTASMHAILAARELAAPEARIGGTHPRLILYRSEHAHSSIDKGAIAVGIGLENIRGVPADENFAMRPEELERVIAEDLAAGSKPFCLVATVGTTSSSSVDPIARIAALARRHGLWMHIDAAYGGPAALLEERRHILDGAALADSIVVNPHKWLFTPVDLSILYTRRPEILRRSLSLEATPAYLATEAHERALNFSEYTLPLGRRFRSLKLWFVLRYYGREGIERIMREHLRLAQVLADEIRRDPLFELSAPVPFSLVCFRYRGSDEENRALLDRINASGRAFLSGTKLNGKFVLRLAIGNLATTETDIRETWELIRSSLPRAIESRL